eukprot:CAMPEP_0117761928 /NCGR_PEP_ID=MMETSP0947-20121206/17583_1 /TAXON_ID=44440 /ORGANISM="Chattonella subsalsa, Strain CCMP2191" /LENGTH=375 /DNA_ID=CAMNT_0005583035 /DNA_START=60 /DNA_END=1184 /DNA_ORIENTATION=-
MSPGIFIGTAGYNYAHWRNDVFYPRGLLHSQELSHFASRIAAVEINTTFHGLPREKTFENWDHQSNPKGNRLRFVFKMLQDITHKSRLGDLDQVRRFVSRVVQNMSSDKILGFLFQLPASFPKDAQKLEKIAYLLRVDLNLECGVIFEFRNAGWFDDEIYGIMQRYRVGVVEQYCPKGVNFPSPPPNWLDDPPGLSYIRMHGSKGSHEHDWAGELPTLSTTLQERLQSTQKHQVVMFLNDWEGKAPQNVDTLYNQLKKNFGHQHFSMGFCPVQMKQRSIASLFSPKGPTDQKLKRKENENKLTKKSTSPSLTTPSFFGENQLTKEEQHEGTQQQEASHDIKYSNIKMVVNDTVSQETGRTRDHTGKINYHEKPEG